MAGVYLYKNGSPSPYEYWERAGYTGDKTTPTPYLAWFKKTSSGDNSYTCNGTNPVRSMHGGIEEEARNRAYERFSGSLKEKMEMVASLAELNSTIDTVADGLGNLAKGLNAIRKGKFSQAAKHLGASDLKKFNDTVAGGWLAYQWALKPIVNDVTKGLNGLTTKMSSFTPVKVSATLSKSSTYTQGNWYWGGQNIDKWDSSVSVRISANVRISNPSLYRASETGLTNPFATALELIPFSFLLDWVSNVGDLVGSLDAFVGLELENAQTTIRREVSHYRTYNGNYPIQAFGPAIWINDHAIEFQRIPGVISPTFQFRNPCTSVVRAANALALLVSVTSSLRS